MPLRLKSNFGIIKANLICYTRCVLNFNHNIRFSGDTVVWNDIVASENINLISQRKRL